MSKRFRVPGRAPAPLSAVTGSVVLDPAAAARALADQVPGHLRASSGSSRAWPWAWPSS